MRVPIEAEFENSYDGPGQGVERTEQKSFAGVKRKFRRVVQQLAVIGLLSQAEVQRAEAGEFFWPEISGPALASSESPASREEILYLENLFGFNNAHEINNQAAVLETPAGPNPRLENFDRRHLDNRELRRLFIETYPKNWVRGETVEVLFSPDSVYLDQDYGIASLQSGLTVGSSRDVSVTLYHRVAGSLERISEVFAHETGHMNDWVRDGTLSYTDRRGLFVAVAKRFFSGSNCYPSTYVDKIRNPVAEEERFLQVQEYWAELCAAYFSQPEDLEQYPEDFALVDAWVKRQDPDFDPYTSARDRQEIIFQYNLRFLPKAARKEFLSFRQQWLEQVVTPEPQILEQHMLDWQKFMAAVEVGKKHNLELGDRFRLAELCARWVSDQRAQKNGVVKSRAYQKK